MSVFKKVALASAGALVLLVIIGAAMGGAQSKNQDGHADGSGSGHYGDGPQVDPNHHQGQD